MLDFWVRSKFNRKKENVILVAKQISDRYFSVVM